MEDLATYARSLPKAELHLHIEGTLEPEMLFSLAERNGVDLPFASIDEVRAAYSFTDLQSFLDIYYQGAAVLVTEQDFYELMRAYLDRAHEDGVVRAEVFFDPQTHTDRGIGFDVFMPGILRAIADAEQATGISTELIMCFLRHLSGDDAVATMRAAEPWLDRILGVGLDSGEVGNPPEEFAEAYAMAAAAGLHRVAHAGEEGPPEYVWGALDTLGVERIDHGVRSDEDDELLARIVDERIPLTMCPLSNLALKVVDRLEDHNLKRLLEAGVNLSINSDDPAYFGGYVGDNYIRTAEALGLTAAELAQIAANSINSSFAPDEDKRRWLERLAAVAAAAAG